MLLNELLHQLCCGIVLRPVAFLKSALTRIFHNGEICAHIGPHLHTSTLSDGMCSNTDSQELPVQASCCMHNQAILSQVLHQTVQSLVGYHSSASVPV